MASVVEVAGHRFSVFTLWVALCRGDCKRRNGFKFFKLPTAAKQSQSHSTHIVLLSIHPMKRNEIHRPQPLLKDRQ